ncbi:MAG: carbohydrate-binding domain-containing protein [Candidatus Marinimicrobia bacterium]|nr:carbohydrate-binding domain-containing protein [Candidatus Neomarinimicrobiota bacterium]
MNKKLLSICFLAFCVTLHAQMMFIHKSDNVAVGVSLSEIKEISIGENNTWLNFSIGDTVVQYAMASIDSISFTESSDTVYIAYNGSYASVINPLAFEGVSVGVDGASVTINAAEEAAGVNYKISGSTSSGSLKIYSEKKFYLFFNNVNITNPIGPAINIQSSKKAFVTLIDGTVNTLTDGSSYCDSIVVNGETEEQDAAFYSEGDLIFDGLGSLTINGKGSIQHGLCSDDFIQIDGGNIIITSAAKDGMNANDGIVIANGTINVTAIGDAIDGGEGYVAISGGNITVKNTGADGNGITCDSTMVITDGTVNMTISGNQSKGLKSGKYMMLSGGDFTINTSGNAVLVPSGSGYDPSYCTAIKSDSILTINGANIILTSIGKGGKGISSDGNIKIMSGSVVITTSGAGATYKNSSGTTDAYNATCLTANGNIEILGGTVTTQSTGSAGKGITADGTLTIGDESNSPQVTITTAGAKITITAGSGGPSGSTGDYAEAKAISCDGAVTINNGTVTISSADDGIKSASSVTINSGTVSITKSIERIEAPIITVNDGDVSIVSSDDSFNATKGNGGETNDGSYLYLKGGNVSVNTSAGDGLDSNGNIVMTAGTVVAHGPTSQPEVGADYNGTFNISGGLLLFTGPNSGNMIEATSTSSTQYAIKVTISSTLNSSTLFHVQDASGNNLMTYKPVRNLYYIVFSSPDLKSGSTYYIYTGGTSTGTYSNGLYIGGTYSGGTQRKSFTLSSKVTSVSF